MFIIINLKYITVMFIYTIYVLKACQCTNAQRRALMTEEMRDVNQTRKDWQRRTITENSFILFMNPGSMLMNILVIGPPQREKISPLSPAILHEVFT